MTTHRPSVGRWSEKDKGRRYVNLKDGVRVLRGLQRAPLSEENGMNKQTVETRGHLGEVRSDQ